jgi:dipeptidyl aminopeptidase/acylaminoacyl peptidase
MAEFSSLLKKNLTLEDVKTWPTLGFYPQISKNGAYFMYDIENQPVGSSTLVVRSTKGNWEKRIPGVQLGSGKVRFSGDSKQVLYQKEDSLFFLSLGSSALYDKVITSVVNFSFSGGSDDWFVYRTRRSKDQTSIYYFKTGKELVLPNTTGFWFEKVGSSLLIKTVIDTGGSMTRSLTYVDIDNGAMNPIWSDTLDCNEITFSNDGSSLVFTVNDKNKTGNNQEGKEILYFKKGMKTAVPIANSNMLNNDYYLVGRPTFMENSNWLTFNFRKNITIIQPEKDVVNVKIWSYKDKIMLPDQIRINNEKRGQKTYKAAINLITNQVVQIENDSDVLSYGPFGDYAIIKGESFVDESWWKLNPSHPTILLSLNDGKRTVLKNDNRSLENFSFSPDGNWLIYYDKSNLNFFSCNLKTKKILNMTKSIPTSFQKESDEGIDAATFPVFGAVAWASEDNTVVLYDNYDIWRVDPSGARKAINITNGYGKKNKIKLRLVYCNETQFGKESLVNLSDSVLIVGFSPENKYNGFFTKVLNEGGDPRKLFMGPYTFYRTESQKPEFFAFSNGTRPIKADSANIWVVSRETASDSKNYFLTEDFKQYRPLTNLYPEKEYNWLTAQLINWKQLDGTMSQGILYKPENFDSTKKYPLLITYYEKMSHRLYEFEQPKFSTGDINISWFVTHGYLVFTPDIHYKIASTSGKTAGEWAYNSVVSAAQYLSKLSYVDKAKMGIEGHSFGGGETNFIITHTNLFAAACEFAGTTDPVSSYLTLVPAFASFEHYSKQHISEYGQSRIGASLWERPDLYLKQSTVLSANKVTSPLLIVHNEIDNNISFRQGIELYMALRRLGKKVWMLQYDDGHNLHQKKNAVDFTIRLTQFFDHYLKNQLPPEWMVKGIPLNLIGKKNGYELEKSQSE